MARSAGYVSADYLRQAATAGQRMKQRSYELLQLAPGARVLDVGCGPGLDTVPLAASVGETGHVTGIDIDPDMLAQADSHAREHGVAARVTHLGGDVRALPFADASFDAVRAERLLQVLPADYAPQQVVAELLRVTRPGGRLVLVDADWGSASVDFSDAALERRLMTFFATRLRPNGYAGRQLVGLCRRAGLADVAVELMPFVHPNPDQTPFGDWLQNEAVQQGAADRDEIAAWRKELTQRSERGDYYSSVNMVLVAGRRPR